MSILDYIQEINEQKRIAESRFGDVGSLEREFFDESYQWLLDNLEFKGGRVVIDDTLFHQMNAFSDAVMNIINTSKAYEGKVARYLNDIATIEKNAAEYHATENNIDFSKLGLDAIRKVFIDGITDAYLQNGLNQHFVAPLKDLVYRQSLLGMNQKQAREVLNSYIVSDQDKSGKLSRYLIQTAQQGVDSYSAMINKKLVETYNFDGYFISGSLIETSSPQCVKAVNDALDTHGFLTNRQWTAILVIAKNHGLIDGTTLKNLDFNKLHWGCRHDFTPAYNKTAVKLDEAALKMDERIKKALEDGQDSLTMNLEKSNLTATRKQLHKKIVDEFFNKGTSKTKRIFTLGGAPANGKSTLVDSGLLSYPEGTIMVNADLIKDRLPEYQQLLSDRNVVAAAFTHEESSLLSKQLVSRAIESKKDFILDGVGDGKFETLKARIEGFKEAGNFVRADYVTMDTDQSLKLARIRGDRTGRYIPEGYLLDMNREISILVPKLLQEKVFDELNLWDTNTKGKPELILSQKNGNLQIFNQDLYDNFINKSK